MSNDSGVPSATPTWQNWSGNLVHSPPSDGQDYYFSPTSRTELQDVVRRAVAAGVSLRVSGQRHSQPPLVADDNRESGPSPTAKTWLIDMSCYADLGAGGDQRMTLDAGAKQVTVNTGAREDDLDEFLTANNLMMQTVTAGGFFSIGGMTAVDVHGATFDAPIFAETVSAFNIMGTDGSVTTVDESTPPIDGWSPLQFARVSLGSLGIVTSVTINVQDRPYATTLTPTRSTFSLRGESEFVSKYKDLLSVPHRHLESFLNPYSGDYLTLQWDVASSPSPETPNAAESIPNACALAEKGEYGSPYEGLLEPAAEFAGQNAQNAGNVLGGYLGRLTTSALIATAFKAIEGMFDDAGKRHSDLWLTKAARVIFMSYFVEMPGIDDAGLRKAYKGLDAVASRVQKNAEFLVAGPLEFRFVHGGNSALAGTYTDNPKATFINLDLIAFVKDGVASSYTQDLLTFFASIEREWVALGGMPHNGKMYGFYDPAVPGSVTAPFNPGFLKKLAEGRAARVQAFEAYRKTRDPNGVFENDYTRALLQ
jgi:FAD/FMN-containing dehydrogenase